MDYPFRAVLNLGTLFVLVWLLWYAVAVEITGRGVSVLTPKTGVRRLADVLAILFGASVEPYADRVIISVLNPYQRVLACVYLVWIFAIIGFYGHDLWASFKAVPSATGKAT